MSTSNKDVGDRGRMSEGMEIRRVWGCGTRGCWGLLMQEVIEIGDKRDGGVVSENVTRCYAMRRTTYDGSGWRGHGACRCAQAKAGR